jgi:hypothetical protein
VSRRVAVVMLTAFACFLVVVTTAKAAVLVGMMLGGTDPHPDRGDGHRRVMGKGQIRFDGFGPERWALRFRREHKLVLALRRELASRLNRVVYLVESFECVHRYEGAWDAHTGNGYYGGLQMDVGFQRTYGRELLSAKGTADRWTPAEQIAVAIAAHATRGFYPWPTTARRCGLIR